MENLTLFNVLSQAEETLKSAYKNGCSRIAPEIFRDLAVYRDFLKMDEPIMLRYSHLSQKYKVSENTIRNVIAYLKKKIITE